MKTSHNNHMKIIEFYPLDWDHNQALPQCNHKLSRLESFGFTIEENKGGLTD